MIEANIELISGMSVGIEFISDDDFNYVIVDALILRFVFFKGKITLDQ
jgi:hypothetical protein